jgi:peptidase E
MPNVDDVTGLLLAQDAVWVSGGSVANLLVLWRLHELDHSFQQAWRAGVVLAGVSAGRLPGHPRWRPCTRGANRTTSTSRG